MTREEAVARIKDHIEIHRYHERNAVKIFEALDMAIKSLEQPERKKGTFIGTEFHRYADNNPVYYEWVCSECGCTFENDEPTYNFCPNCGCEIER